jgi:hypothetical protein
MDIALESISVGPMQNTIASRNGEKRKKILDLLNDDGYDDFRVNTQKIDN